MRDKIIKNFFYFSLVAVFIITFFVSFTLSSNAYFQIRKQATGQIVLGKANMVFINNAIDAKVELGKTVSYPISIINANDVSGNDTTGLIDCYLRVKTNFTSNGGEVDVVSATLAEPTNWVSNSDGYIYYKPVFTTGSKVDIYTSLVVASEIPESVLESGVHISITAETIQAYGNLYKTNWSTAPTIW